eukprot:TRINITY_DN10408_c0_g1_i2.p1 TRINITY_DN10408_c0_g1~~TRINITY_DN10408_c0_g1_i2.p1  ORF type:complete len:158 (-),score=33.18 TRINITY_DN10408_c0_g1_i2:229-702(-)
MNYKMNERDLDPVLAAKKKILLRLAYNRISHSQPNSLGAVETLIKIFGNILSHPGEEMYRKLKIKSNVYQLRLAEVDGVKEFLYEVGFTRQIILFEEYLVLSNPDYSVITVGLSVLEDCHSLCAEKSAREEKKKQDSSKEEEEYQRAIKKRIEEAGN